jgi:hypothetical protein
MCNHQGSSCQMRTSRLGNRMFCPTPSSYEERDLCLCTYYIPDNHHIPMHDHLNKHQKSTSQCFFPLLILPVDSI